MDQNNKLNHVTFLDPPRRFGLMPFWFWNDDLEEATLLDQLRQFHAAGFGGFIPHVRIGLSRRVGYLTDEYFRLLRICVQEAARLEMKVVLYDEGCYPSGSAQGRVVAENPQFASRCLFPITLDIEGPACGYWRPNPGRSLTQELLAVVLGRVDDTGTLCETTVLPIQPPGMVRYDLGPGRWKLVSAWTDYSGGVIRGVFAEEDDSHATAPAAGDILNPDAIASFIRHTHEQFYRHLREHFGSTIVAMFTDEPNPLGRSRTRRRGRDARPYYSGVFDDLASLSLNWLPALWFDSGPRTEEFRRAYQRIIDDRIEAVFYAPISKWCEDHGIALTGHPQQPDEMGALRHFHWPGQDVVWRHLELGNDSGLRGPHSVIAKAAASAAVLGGRPHSVSELLGAYGWKLSLDEVKWLLDWHLIRGNNLLFPHACFYSIRGGRAYESEPDLGVHNVWWPHFRLIGDYARRLCWLLTTCEIVCDLAVLIDPHHVAWAAAEHLYQHQMDFLYVTPEQVAGGVVEGSQLRIGERTFRAIVCDPPAMGDAVSDKLDAWSAAGGIVLRDWTPQSLVAELPRDFTVLPPAIAPDLRVLHLRHADQDLFLLANEGESAIDCPISIPVEGAMNIWDPMDGSSRPWPAQTHAGRTEGQLLLERREALVFVHSPQSSGVSLAPPPRLTAPIALTGPWQAFDVDGRVVDTLQLGDWARDRRFETFTGTLRYETTFNADAPSALLDLGAVGEIAEVYLNDVRIGVRAWAPYRFYLTCRRGRNTLCVRVTNSMANSRDGAQRPSGLMGPVMLSFAEEKSC